MATKKSRLVIAIILMLSLVSFFSIPASVFAESDQTSDSEQYQSQSEDKGQGEDEFDKNDKEIKYYDVKFKAAANGSVAGDLEQTVKEGDSTTEVIAVPNEGYVFKKWAPDKQIDEHNPKLNIAHVDKDTANEYEAIFEKAPILDGKLIINKVLSGSEVNEDLMFTFTIQKWIEEKKDKEHEDHDTTPAHWGKPETVQASSKSAYVSSKKDGGDKYLISETSPQNGYTRSGSESQVVTINGNTEVTFINVKNEAPNLYTVTYLADSNGTLSGTASFLVDSGSAYPTPPTPVANGGYHFTNWAPTLPVSGDNVTGPATFTAHFAINTYAVNYLADSNGTLSGTASFLVDSGSAYPNPPTPVAKTGYVFSDWTPTLPGSTDTVTGPKTYTANFVLDRETTYAIKYVAGANGSLTGGDRTDNKIYGAGFDAAPTPIANTGYVFSGWTPALPGSSDTVTGPKTYTAIFSSDQQTTYAIKYVAGANGSLTGGDRIDYKIFGASFDAAPTPVATTGYVFSDWTPTLPGSSDTVTGPKTYTATFVPDRETTYAIKYVAGANGSLTGGDRTDNKIYGAGFDAAPTPIANSGYHFTAWTPTLPTEDETVVGNATYTATFAIDTVVDNGTPTRRTTVVVQDVPVIIEEPEVLPAGEAIIPVTEDATPGAPTELPKTGGLDPGFLYGLGALLAGSGLVIKRRKDK